MFTLSEKFRVLNTPSETRVFDAANAEVITSAAILDTDRLFIEGYGNFDVAKIANIKMRRSVPASIDSRDFTALAPAGLAIGDAIEVCVYIQTSRYQSEILATNHLGNGRTIKFMTLPLTAVTPTAIAAAIVAGWQSWLAAFTVGQPFLDVVAGAAATDVQFNSTPGYESITIQKVGIKRVVQGQGPQSEVLLTQSVVNSVGFEGLGLGKFLEESVRMATPMNTDPYGVDVTGTRVDIRGSYTEVSFDYSTSYEENLGTTAADFGHTGLGGPAIGGVAATHTFSIFLNEATSLAVDDAIAKLAAIALLRAAVLASLTATVTPAPLSAADERTEVLIFTDGSSVDTVAAFIA